MLPAESAAYCDAMAKNGKLAHLAQVRLFGALNKKELGLLGRAADEVSVPAGKVLVSEGAAGHEFYLIIEGQAIVRRGGRRVAMLGPGQYFGELSLLDRGPRTATVVADSEMTLLVLGQREFSALLEEVPIVAHKLLETMARRLRECDSRATSH
jgi:CRP/FNR family transcriptional regulator, cyclic AMP receptor protein